MHKPEYSRLRSIASIIGTVSTISLVFGVLAALAAVVAAIEGEGWAIPGIALIAALIGLAAYLIAGAGSEALRLMLSIESKLAIQNQILQEIREKITESQK